MALVNIWRLKWVMNTLSIDDICCCQYTMKLLSTLTQSQHEAPMLADEVRTSFSKHFQTSSPACFYRVYIDHFDAGTEENNELCTHIPGPACDVDSGNLRASPGEGPIHIHRGVHGIGDIAASNYDWRNPVAEVFVSSL